jgi:hypothetical protein
MSKVVSVAATFACVGLVLMVIFLLFGAASPEPKDHPEWEKQALHSNTAGRILVNCITYCCLPAWLVERWLPYTNMFWLRALIIQGTLYFVVGFVLAKIWYRYFSHDDD